MVGADRPWAADRLPDGSIRRRDERAAAATQAADALLAAATKAAEALSAARLASAQRAGARDLADQHRVTALDVAVKAEATAESTRQEAVGEEGADVRGEAASALASAQADAAEDLAGAQADAAEDLAGAQADAASDLAAAHVEAAADLLAAANAAADVIAGVRDEAVKELARAEEQFRLVMDWAGVAGCTVSNEGRILRVNRAMCELLGRTQGELLGAALQDMTHPDDIGIVNAQIHDLLAGQRSSFRTLSRYVASDGRVVWGDLSVAAVLKSDGTAAFHVAQIVDVTARVDYEAVLEELAAHDSLTGLASRTAMLNELDRALSAQGRSGRAAGVLVIDLDHFKNINESLGHAAGDALLKAAASRIESVVRGGDMAARPGGDEFVVVMRDLDDPADAIRTAWRLVEAFRRPLLVDGDEMFATASIGVAVRADTPGIPDAREAGDLLREADTAMYRAKSDGRDRVSVYDEDLRATVSARLAVERDLRHALRRGQLAVWYQPEIDLNTGTVIAVEALLRWHHPDGSVWTADRFIDVAEETGLILEIGDWALRTACAQGASWAAARPDRPIIVRVNKSALQVAGTGLLGTLDDALATSGLNPALLCIEITETAVLHETATTRGNLAGVRARGVHLAIDDFGTGYASLIQLRRYPIDVIKIDRSFVTNITTIEHDRAIVAPIIALASALDMIVTAEGVEHPDQAATLRDMGCPGAQGWLYSKAVPADEATLLLNHEYPHV
jgi:diguanylate cyclase (GGDEF)-like protein/PAS domain S-box-containing protein